MRAFVIWIISVVNKHIIDYPQPTNLNYYWGLGSLAGLYLMVQIIIGVFLCVVLNFIFLATLTHNPPEYIIVLFLITIEVVEAAIGLCLFILIHKYFKNTNLLKY